MAGPIIRPAESFKTGNSIIDNIIGTIFPADDPTGGLSPNVTGPAAGLITRFVSGGKVNKPLREAHTAKFLDNARQLVSEGPDLSFIERFAQKYPRVAAHAKLGKHTRTAYDKSEGVTQLGKANEVQIPGADPGRGRIPLNINPQPDLNFTTVPETLAHEMGHVAQGLGNKQAPDLYTLSQSITGYRDNPFEASARAISKRKVKGQHMSPPDPVMPKLREISQYPLTNAVGPQTPGGLTQAMLNGSVINQILTARRMGTQIPNYNEMIIKALRENGLQDLDPSFLWRHAPDPPAKTALPTGREAYDQLRLALQELRSPEQLLTPSGRSYMERIRQLPEVMELLKGGDMPRLGPDAQTEMLDNDKIHRLLRMLAD